MDDIKDNINDHINTNNIGKNIDYIDDPTVIKQETYSGKNTTTITLHKNKTLQYQNDFRL